MTHKQIEASREVRLWIGQVIVPAGLAVIVAASNPNVRSSAKAKVLRVKTKLKNKFKKKKIEPSGSFFYLYHRRFMRYHYEKTTIYSSLYGTTYLDATLTGSFMEKLFKERLKWTK